MITKKNSYPILNCYFTVKNHYITGDLKMFSFSCCGNIIVFLLWSSFLMCFKLIRPAAVILGKISIEYCISKISYRCKSFYINLFSCDNSVLMRKFKKFYIEDPLYFVCFIKGERLDTDKGIFYRKSKLKVIYNRKRHYFHDIPVV